MQIEYLKELEKNSYSVEIDLKNRSISETEILHLEQLYNNGNPFPKALTELLYLAGNFCYVLDYGINDSQEELQEFVRDEMEESNKVIDRPFYVIDIYNAGTQFLFIYLDEVNNPPVHEGHYRKNNSNWITLISDSLSEYINSLIKDLKEGYGPF